MTAVIRHTVPELRAELRRIATTRRGRLAVDPVQEELVLVGLARPVAEGRLDLTPAGRRFL